MKKLILKDKNTEELINNQSEWLEVLGKALFDAMPGNKTLEEVNDKIFKKWGVKK